MMNCKLRGLSSSSQGQKSEVKVSVGLCLWKAVERIRSRLLHWILGSSVPWGSVTPVFCWCLLAVCRCVLCMVIHFSCVHLFAPLSTGIGLLPSSSKASIQPRFKPRLSFMSSALVGGLYSEPCWKPMYVCMGPNFSFVQGQQSFWLGPAYPSRLHFNVTNYICNDRASK